MSELLSKTPQEAVAEIEAANNLAKSLFAAFKSLLSGFLPGTTITKKTPLNIEVERRKLQPQPERLATHQQPAKIGTQKPSDGNSHSERLRQQGRIYGSGVNKLTEADLQAIAAIVNGKKGAVVGSDYDYTIRHNGKILFETTMGEVTTHTRLSKELHHQIVNLKAGTSPAPTATPAVVVAPETTNSVEVTQAANNLAAQIKDFVIDNGNLLDPEMAKSLMKTFRQLKSGIVPEPNRVRTVSPAENPTQSLENSQFASSNQPEPSISVPEQVEANKSQAVTTSPTAAVTETQESERMNERDLKIVPFLFNLFGRNTNKENHNTSNGREGILELPTGAKLINEIDAGTAYLTLMRDDVIHEIGSYNHQTKDYAVGSGLVNIKAELADLKSYIDPETLTIDENNRNLVEPTIEQNQPEPQSIEQSQPESEQSQLEPEQQPSRGR